MPFIFATSKTVPIHIQQLFKNDNTTVTINADGTTWTYPYSLIKPQIGLLEAEGLLPPYVIDLECITRKSSGSYYSVIHDSLLNLSDSLRLGSQEQINWFILIKMIDFLDAHILRIHLENYIVNTVNCPLFLFNKPPSDRLYDQLFRNHTCDEYFCYKDTEDNVRFYKNIYNLLCQTNFNSCALVLEPKIAEAKYRYLSRQMKTTDLETMLKIEALMTSIDSNSKKRKTVA